MISIRASKVPLLLCCGQSAADTGISIDSDNQEARLGTAGHDGAAEFAAMGAHSAAADLAEKHGVDDADELSMMLAFAREAVTAMRPNFPNPIVEQSLAIQLSEDVELTGHADLMTVGDDYVAVADYKTGRKHRDYIDQLKAYALLACAAYDKPRWSVTLVWLRDHDMVTRSGTRDELEPFRLEMIAAAKGADAATYVVSDACEHCPRFINCPARSALLRQTANDIAGIPADSFAALGPRLFDLYNGVKFLEKACEDFRKLLKAEVERTGAIVYPGVGTAKFIEFPKRSLLPMAAWPVLQDRLTEEEIEAATTISIGTIEDTVAKNAGRGNGKRAKEQLIADLDAAGAIERRTEKRLSVTTETK